VQIEVVPVIWVFAGWAAVTAAYFVAGARAGAVAAPASTSPYLSERAAVERLHELSRSRFGAKSVTYQVFVNGCGALLLVFFVLQGKLWAGLFFVPLGLWMIYDSLSSPFLLRELHPRLVGAPDWAYFLTGIAVWAYCLACVGMRLEGKAW